MLKAESHNDRVVHTSIDGIKSTWKKKEVIGEGGFGKVWLQEKEGTGELRAVKILHWWKDARQSRELQNLVKLQSKFSPHLFIEFFGWYQNGENLFIAMEYIKLGDLCKCITDRGRVPIFETKEITRQILEGLESIHSERIYHRDLKPQNILMACHDPIWVKIADFGGSKHAHSNTAVRTRFGTASYMPPEVLFTPPPGDVFSHALDIWALGVLLHVLLTSEVPFRAVHEFCQDIVSAFIIDEHESRLNEQCTDTKAVFKYFNDEIGFPVGALQKSQVDDEGIEFLKGLMLPSPKSRPTASKVLKDLWLEGYTSRWVEDMSKEFSELGVNLVLGEKNRIFIRQLRKADITRFFPDDIRESASSIVMKAATKGYELATNKLLELQSIDYGTREHSLREAIRNGRRGTVRILIKKHG